MMEPIIYPNVQLARWLRGHQRVSVYGTLALKYKPSLIG